MDEKKYFMVYLIIMIIVVIIVFYATISDNLNPRGFLQNGVKDILDIVKTKKVALKDLNENPNSYDGKRVKISGELKYKVFEVIKECKNTIYYLADENEKGVDFCPSDDREFVVGKDYSITGKVIKIGDYPLVIEDN